MKEDFKFISGLLRPRIGVEINAKKCKNKQLVKKNCNFKISNHSLTHVLNSDAQLVKMTRRRGYPWYQNTYEKSLRKLINSMVFRRPQSWQAVGG